MALATTPIYHPNSRERDYNSPTHTEIVMSDCCSSQPATVGENSLARVKAPCPECGHAGRPVATLTLKQMVLTQYLNLVSDPGFLFCRTAGCEVVYFHPDGQRLHKSDVRVRVGLKETADPVPICYCFGFTEGMLLEEIRTTGGSTIPDRIAVEMKAGYCACETRNPQGSCCMGNVAAALKRALKPAAIQTN